MILRQVARLRMRFWLRVNHFAWPLDGERLYRLRAFHNWLDPLFLFSHRRWEHAIGDYVRHHP